MYIVIITVTVCGFFIDQAFAGNNVSLIPTTNLYSGPEPCAKRLKEKIATINKNTKLSQAEREDQIEQATADNEKTCYEFLEPLPAVDDTGNPAEATAIEITPSEGISGSFNNLYGIAIGIGSVLAVIMIAVYGFKYMSGNKSVYENSALKEKITNVLLGVLLLLGIYVILQTINPELLDTQPEIGEQTIVAERISDPEWVANISSIDTTGVVYNENITKDDIFLMYLTHQQGASGGSAIIKAAKSNTTVSSEIAANMRSNFPPSDVGKVLGTTVLTPSSFLKYWGIKVAAVQKNPPAVSTTIKTALEFASQKSNIPYDGLRVMCKLESSCLDKNITAKNKFGYKGLFQLSDKVFDIYKKYFNNPNIFDPLQNAYTAAMYGVDNLKQIKKKLN